MNLCWYNPQMLNHDQAIELVHRHSGKVDNNGNTTLILLFWLNPEKTDFNSNSFKLLWEKEKDIEVDSLKIWMQKKPALKEKVITAISNAAAYYE